MKRIIIIKRTIFLILIILTSLIIFGFSAQNGTDSSSISNKIANVIVDIFYKNENNIENIINQVERVIRKLAHFSIYTLLGIWIMSFVNTFYIKDKVKIIATIICGFLYACSDEFHQSFVGGRMASPIDVVIDTFGIIFGLLIVFIIKKIYDKITIMLQKD